MAEGGVVGGKAVQAGEQEGGGAVAGEARIEVGAKARAPGEPGHGVGLGRGQRAVAQGVVGAPEQAGGEEGEQEESNEGDGDHDYLIGAKRAGLQRETRLRSASKTTASRAPTTVASNWVPALARSSSAATSRGQGAAVAAIAGHRVPRVADEDDARAQRDVLAGQAVGVAAAVPALVAGAHDAAHGAQRLGRADDALADDRVLADERSSRPRRAGRACAGSRRGPRPCRCRAARRRAHHDVEVLGVEAEARAHAARASPATSCMWRCRSGSRSPSDGQQDLARLALRRARGRA